MAEYSANLVHNPDFESDVDWLCFGYDSGAHFGIVSCDVESNFLRFAIGTSFLSTPVQSTTSASQTIFLPGEYSSFVFEVDIECPPVPSWANFVAEADFQDSQNNVLGKIEETAFCSDYVGRSSVYKTISQPELQFAVSINVILVGVGSLIKMTNVRLYAVSSYNAKCTPCSEGSFSALPGELKVPWSF